MEQLNIVELIENNPVSKLSNTYNNKLLEKIKNTFTNFEQQLFISSFYCYLKYDKNNDFVVDLDDVWKWLGFKQKIDAKRLLEKYFVSNIDYNINSTLIEEIYEMSSQNVALGKSKAVLANENGVKKNGGQNIKKIYMTIKCFKRS